MLAHSSSDHERFIFQNCTECSSSSTLLCKGVCPNTLGNLFIRGFLEGLWGSIVEGGSLLRASELGEGT
jgi:hypothetical protein